MSGQKVAIAGFGTALMVITAMGWLSYRHTSALIATERRVAHAHRVQTELEAMLTAVAEAEAAQRGYVVAGEARHLEPYRAAVGEVDRTLDRLRRLTADNPNQQQRISMLKSLLDEKVAQWQHSIDFQQVEGFHPGVQIALADRGKELMDQIRWLVETMKAEERASLAQWDELSKARARVTYVSIPLGIGLGCMLLSLVLYRFMR